MIQLLASLWSIRKDHDGEVRVQLVIPSTQADEAIKIPEGKVLRITIEEENE